MNELDHELNLDTGDNLPIKFGDLKFTPDEYCEAEKAVSRLLPHKRMVFGACSKIANQLNLDSQALGWMRLWLGVSILIWGPIFWVYVIASIVLPRDNG